MLDPGIPPIPPNTNNNINNNNNNNINNNNDDNNVQPVEVPQACVESIVEFVSAGQIIRERWKIVKCIGNGGFGQIYEAEDIDRREAVAVKIEQTSSNKQVLKMEVAVLKKIQGCIHACEFLGCGRMADFNYLVMTLQGPSLSDLRKKQVNLKFSLSTALRISAHALEAVRAIHECGFLHRDIKPSNFTIGRTTNTRHNIYILDFGLARQFTLPTGEVRQKRDKAAFRGTVRYASITAHKNEELGRQDDLWSLFYMTVEFITGQLPWRKIKEKDTVGKIKESYNHELFLSSLPHEFRHYYSHILSLTYFDKPDYYKLKAVFDAAMSRLYIGDYDLYDWELTLHSSVLAPVSVHQDIKTLSQSKTNCSEPFQERSGVKQSRQVKMTGREVLLAQKACKLDSNCAIITHSRGEESIQERDALPDLDQLQITSHQMQHAVKQDDVPCIHKMVHNNSNNYMIAKHKILPNPINLDISAALPSNTNDNNNNNTNNNNNNNNNNTNNNSKSNVSLGDIMHDNGRFLDISNKSLPIKAKILPNSMRLSHPNLANIAEYNRDNVNIPPKRPLGVPASPCVSGRLRRYYNPILAGNTLSQDSSQAK